MLKRSCPFESHPNQLKTHVGQKEVAQGVNKEKHMKEVYEKTLAMMFASQRQSGKDDVNSAAATPHNVTSSSDHSGHRCHSQVTELLPGQCLLDEHGKVINRQTAVPNAIGDAESVSKPPQLTMTAHCYTCRESLCPRCARIRLQCDNPFCSMCSLINYDEDVERILCLSCSSHMM